LNMKENQAINQKKECFGNYMQYPICQGHHECKEKGCYAKTMSKGPCECLYKESCHIPRQTLQTEFREKYGQKLEDCDFYKLLKPKYEKKNKHVEKPCTMPTCDGCMSNDICGGVVIDRRR